MSGELLADEFEKLPERETKRLAELEEVIKQDLKAFLRVGSALAEIQQSRLYRSNFKSLKDYMAVVWDLGESHGHRLIDAHVVVEQLQLSAPPNSPIGEFIPKNEAQIRPLVKYKDNPEKLAQIWNQAIETAPNGKVTAKHVQQTLFNVVGKTTTNNTGKQRAAVNKDELLSDDFKKSFEAMITEIDRARIGKYRHTSREAIIKHLDALRDTVAIDGAKLPDYTVKNQTDRNKLLNGGFRIFRKNPDNLCIEEQTGSGLWEHHQTCDDTEDLTKKYNALLRDDSHLRG